MSNANNTFFMLRHTPYSTWQLVQAPNRAAARKLYEARLGFKPDWPIASPATECGPLPLTAWKQARRLRELGPRTISPADVVLWELPTAI